MKKIFTMLCVAVLIPAGMWAATSSYRSIAVKHADHHLSVITIESGMTTTTTNGNLQLASDKGVISIALSDVRNWTFSNEAGTSDLWAVIGAVEADALCIQMIDKAILLGNLPKGSSVGLTSIAGINVVSRQGLEGGVYATYRLAYLGHLYSYCQ